MIVKPNARNQGDGLEFLKSLADNSVAACFFDPPIEKDWAAASAASATWAAASAAAQKEEFLRICEEKINE